MKILLVIIFELETLFDLENLYFIGVLDCDLMGVGRVELYFLKIGEVLLYID